VTEEIGLKEPTSTSARDRQMTAFHEAGHAVLGYVLELDDQIQVASIIKRRDTLGVVYRTPIEERHTELREDMRRDIIVSLGGLAAEQIWFGDTTGGPASDLRQATYRAAVMLGMLGMGENLISYGVLNENPYGGGPMSAILQDKQNREAIGKLLIECRQEAVELLRRNEPAVRALAERLLEKDEVQGEEIEELMKAKAVARATPAFRPMLELVGETWHAPMLVEADRRDGPADKRDQATPPPPRPSWRSSDAQGPVADRSEAPREFEW
jgi:cell division protease FtsH